MGDVCVCVYWWVTWVCMRVGMCLVTCGCVWMVDVRCGVGGCVT